MKQFYQQVSVDYKSGRFQFICPVCGKVEYGIKVPFLCSAGKTISLCEQGRAMGLWQDIFNRRKAKAVTQLSHRVNLCTNCGRFVCDNCYSRANPTGSCAKCSEMQTGKNRGNNAAL